MRHLGLSGGSTKIAGIAGAAYQLMEQERYAPDVISGVSAGAILTLPIVLGKFKQVESVVKNLKLSDIFDVSPVNEKGKIGWKSIWRVICGKTSLGRQRNMIKTLKSIISEEDFINYKANYKYPIIYIGTVDFKTGSRVYFNLKDKSINYEKYLQIILASASLPVFTESVHMQCDGLDTILYDGGIRDSIPTSWVLENHPGITETVSVIARAQDYKMRSIEWTDENVMNVLSRYVDITNIEISKSDEALEDLLCEKMNVKQTKVFLPIQLKSAYEIDHDKLAVMYNVGRASAADAMLKNKTLER